MNRREFRSKKPVSVVWLALVLLLLLAACGGRSGGILPRIETTNIGLDVYGQPVPLTFAALQADPALYQNTNIVVSGAYTPLPRTNCAPFPDNGPRIGWGLISDQLRLDAINLDEVLALVPQGTQVTVEGIWRLYIGPVGCGKEPAHNSIWYLEALRVVQPNPLPVEVAAPAADPGQQNEGGQGVPVGEDQGNGGDGQIIGQPDATATGTVTVIGSGGTPTATQTLAFGTVDPSATASASVTGTVTGTASPTVTGTSPPGATLTNTPPPGASFTPTLPFPTSTQAPSSTPLVTATAGPSPTFGPTSTPRPTSTPGGYPGATNTPSPTSTPSGYP